VINEITILTIVQEITMKQYCRRKT